jgi:Raf kinase inhibitor-like YbhB/YbcL family protein
MAETKGKAAAIQVTSPAFKEGEVIPRDNTCEGKDLSPALQWGKVPDGTKGLALICDDPDAPVGTWVHWVIYGIPADATGLPAGVPTDKELETGAKQGTNDFKNIGYGGPCPPKGHGFHRYFFKLYALDAELALKPGATKKDLEAAMKGHILAEGQLIGKYQRK